METARIVPLLVLDLTLPLSVDCRSGLIIARVWALLGYGLAILA